MRQQVDPNLSPYDRVMAKRRRDWRLHLIAVLIVIVVSVGVGLYRRETNGPPMHDFTLNPPAATK